MGPILSSQLFSAFLDCPTKCFLRSRHVVSDANEYAEWVRRREQVYVNNYARCLAGRKHEVVTGDVLTGDLRTSNWQVAMDVRVNTKDLEAHLQLVERIHNGSEAKLQELVPTAVIHEPESMRTCTMLTVPSLSSAVPDTLIDSLTKSPDPGLTIETLGISLSDSTLSTMILVDLISEYTSPS